MTERRLLGRDVVAALTMVSLLVGLFTAAPRLSGGVVAIGLLLIVLVCGTWGSIASVKRRQAEAAAPSQDDDLRGPYYR